MGSKKADFAKSYPQKWEKVGICGERWEYFAIFVV